jgi:hypothetical protein
MYFGSGARENAQKKFVQFIPIGGEKVNVCCTRSISKNGINFQKSKKKHICRVHTTGSHLAIIFKEQMFLSVIFFQREGTLYMLSYCYFCKFANSVNYTAN